MKSRFFKKGICVFLGLMMLLSILPTASAAEEQRYYFTTAQSVNNCATDGGYYVTGLTLEKGASGENAIKMSGSSRCLWAVTNAILESMPYLYYKTDGGMNKFTVSHYWDVEPEIDLPIEEGEHCINLLELVEEYDTIGWTYIVPYVWVEGVEGTSEFEYFYLSNMDEEGNVYEKPVQPLAPATSPAMEERWQLKADTQDNVDDQGYGWLMSITSRSPWTVTIQTVRMALPWSVQKALKQPPSISHGSFLMKSWSSTLILPLRSETKAVWIRDPVSAFMLTGSMLWEAVPFLM